MDIKEIINQLSEKEKSIPNDYEFGKSIREFILLELKDVIIDDKYIRLLAEFENYKKRIIKEKTDLVNKTKSDMISSILDIDSDLYLASKNNKDEGLNLIISKLEHFLNSINVKSIQTDVYDSNIHDVVGSIESNESNKIIDVVNKGYKLNDVIIRYPKVILSI